MAAARQSLPLLWLAIAALACIGLSISLGSIAISASDLWAVVTGNGQPLHNTLILEL